MQATVPQWISAFGTSAATLIAASALSLQQRDRRREPATNVSAWTVSEETDMVRATLHVLNSGKRPIFSVVVRAVEKNGKTKEAWALGDIPPEEESTALGEKDWGNASYAHHPPQLEIRFRDAAGRSWRHHPNGKITRVWRDRKRTAFNLYMKWSMESHELEEEMNAYYEGQ